MLGIGPGWEKLGRQIAEIAERHGVIIKEIGVKDGRMEIVTKNKIPLKIKQLFEHIQRKSETTCEECGAVGKRYSIGKKILTLCAEHALEVFYEQ